jgi:hypothetical protein
LLQHLARPDGCKLVIIDDAALEEDYERIPRSEWRGRAPLVVDDDRRV